MVKNTPGIETVLLDLVLDPRTSGGLEIALGAVEVKACLEEDVS